jgi:phosphoribosylaminoimidazolecarboxamide formyltransferase/IMP cyclohydrolase
MVRVRRALLSVSDKTGVAAFASGLRELDVELVSTGGTARTLREAGLPVTDVSQVTGFPELLDGRVKTLHPRIHGALLGLRDHPDHERQMADAGMVPIDLVAVNLYPFEATAARSDLSLADALEQIDIGGPAMIRAAAKNFPAVAVLVDPADYPRLLEELRAGRGSVPLATRLALARKAFAHTARYDARIAAYLERGELSAEGTWSAPATAPVAFPEVLTLAFEKVKELRYGENPHQRAALYRDPRAGGGIAGAEHLHGKELSYNNLMDLQAAWELVQEWAEPVVAIVKHTNPCGVATAADLATAYLRARDTDPVSAYGGIIGVNRPLDAPTAREIAATFVEAIAAPGYEAEALALLRAKKGLRLLAVPTSGPGAPGLELRRVSGGLLVQEPDGVDLDPAALRVVTRRDPDASERRALRFAWRVAKHVKSNAIVLATEGATVGIGAGQMSRVDSVRLACQKARRATRGTVLASDAFFPFRDGVDAAAEAGVTAIIQPGGSVRDAEVIAAADTHGLAMLFTGLRHFRH